MVLMINNKLTHTDYCNAMHEFTFFSFDLSLVTSKLFSFYRFKSEYFIRMEM